MSEEHGLVRRTWTKFRRLPLWAQIVAWVFVAAIAFAPFNNQDEKDAKTKVAAHTTTTRTTEPKVTTTERVTTTKPPTTTRQTTTSTPPSTTTTSASLGPNAQRIAAADLGDDWPLTITSGVLSCPAGKAVVFGGDDTAYALNGTARGMAADRGWTDIYESDIWASDPAYPGLDLKKDIGPLIDHGLDLCG